MAVFVLADTHLSLGGSKAMDDFGGWREYVPRLERNWRAAVSPEDTVVLPGDISWGMSLQEALPDFQFLQSLPGRKLLMKGNHDYWWGTRKKTEEFFCANGLTTLGILHNTSVLAEGLALCGTRGWTPNPDDPHDFKLVRRESQRLELSLQSAGEFGGAERVVFLHYPPLFANEMLTTFLQLLERYGVRRCYYGHLHGQARSQAVEGEHRGIVFRLVSADHLDFTPLRVGP